MKTFFLTGLLLTGTALLGIEESRALTWPAPPDPARIGYVASVTKAEDLGIEKGFFTKIYDFIFGGEEPVLSTPFGIHADKERIYVTDIGAKTLMVFDLKREKVMTLEGSEKERFLYPVDVVTDSRGNIYVSDSVLAKVFVFEPDGDFSHVIAFKALQRPVGIDVSADGQWLYIVDALSSQIHIVTLKGKLLGSIGKNGNGNGEFNRPTYMDVGADGKLYITDSMNHRIQVLDKEGNYLFSFGYLSQNIGGFGSPRGIALDDDGNIYVSDTLFNAVQIFNPKGELLMVFGEYGSSRGSFALPEDIAIIPGNTIYISDMNNKRFQIFKRLEVPKARSQQ